MTNQQVKPVMINIRAKSPQKTLIDKAANHLNKSRSEFMLEISCREAENVLLDQKLFLLDKDQYEQFNALLTAPVAKSSELKNLLESTSPWEK